MHFSIHVIRLILLLFQPAVSGEIVYVSDGDTYRFVTSWGEKMKVRLEGVDCPEMTQEFGLEAKAYAAKQVLNKKANIRIVETDRYGRQVAKIYYDGKDLAKELLRNGYAWHYKAYNQDPELARLEAAARKEKKGLWSKNHPMPPWEYRRSVSEMRDKEQRNEVSASGNTALICNSSSSYAYHKERCRGLKRCKAEILQIPVSKARSAGRKPCGWCWKMSD